MALTDKNIVITPNIGSSTDDPKMVFTSANTTNSYAITVRTYPTSNGTLSFEGGAGQLFSISNTLSGTIYSVNDVSGMPSVQVMDTGNIYLAPYSGNVTVGNTSTSFGNFFVGGNLYDNSNPSYYVKPSGTSNLNYVTGTSFQGGSWGSYLNPSTAAIRGNGAYGGALALIDGSYGIALYSVSGTLYFGLGSNTSVSSIALLTSAGNWYLNGTYYDNANTSYYVKPSGTSNLSVLNLSANSGGSIITLLSLKDLYSGGGQTYFVMFGGSLGRAIAGDALWSNTVGNLFISPNASGKNIYLVGSTWTSTPGLTVNSSNYVGIQNTTPTTYFDVSAGNNRTLTNSSATPSAMYVTGTSSDVETTFISQFRHGNQSQGVGFGYDNIRATGSNTNQDLYIAARGTGALRLNYGSTDTSLGSASLYINGNGAVYSNLIYDINNSSYYVQPSSSSNLNALQCTGNLTVQSATYLGSKTSAYNVALYCNANWNYSSLDITRNASNTSSVRLIGMMLDGDNIASTSLGDFNAIWGIYNASPTTGSTSASLQGVMAYASYYGHRWYVNGTIISSFDNSGNAVFKGNVTAYGSPSDRRLKENIRPLYKTLNKVLDLNPVSFDWKEETQENQMVGMKEDIGLIAQEVQEVFPELVREGDDGMLSLRDRGLFAILIQAIKEQQKQIEELRELINVPSK